MVSEETVAGFDQTPDAPQARQTRQWLQWRDAFQGPDHGLATGGPVAILVDDVKGATQITRGAKPLHLGSIRRGPLQGHQAEAPPAIEACQPCGDARADSTARIVEDRQSAILGATGHPSHGCG